jgi:hypothetical protein
VKKIARATVVRITTIRANLLSELTKLTNSFPAYSFITTSIKYFLQNDETPC